MRDNGNRISGKCPHCGADIEASIAKCPVCGAAFSAKDITRMSDEKLAKIRKISNIICWGALVAVLIWMFFFKNA